MRFMRKMELMTDSLEFLQFIVPRFLVAILCGTIVGLERELKSKPAGLKTNIMICLGAALFTSASLLIPSESTPSGSTHADSSRIAAQIVSGIGFLGGGVILKSQGSVIGLTTAATIWAVAGLGICAGIGEYFIALFGAGSMVISLRIVSEIEHRVLGRSSHFQCLVRSATFSEEFRDAFYKLLLNNNLKLEDFHVQTSGNDCEWVLRYRGHKDQNKRFLMDLWNLQGTREVKLIT